MLDTFLKEHDKELTSMVGKCLTIQKDDDPYVDKFMPPTIVQGDKTHDNNDNDDEVIVDPYPNRIAANNDYFKQKIEAKVDHKIDNRPFIGDTIPEDPFANMFNSNKNPNANTTRIGDRR